MKENGRFIVKYIVKTCDALPNSFEGTCFVPMFVDEKSGLCLVERSGCFSFFIRCKDSIEITVEPRYPITIKELQAFEDIFVKDLPPGMQSWDSITIDQLIDFCNQNNSPLDFSRAGKLDITKSRQVCEDSKEENAG